MKSTTNRMMLDFSARYRSWLDSAAPWRSRPKGEATVRTFPFDLPGLPTLVALFMALAPESTYAVDIEFKQVTATLTSAPAHGPYVVGSQGAWRHQFTGPEWNAVREAVPGDYDEDQANVGFRAAGAQESEELGESAHVAGPSAAIPISTKTWKVDPNAGLGVRDLDIAASSNHLLLGTLSRIAVFKKDGTLLGSTKLTDLFQSIIVDINKTVKDPGSPSGALVGNSGFEVDDLFDTRLAFDTYRNRFWILSIARNLKSKGSQANQAHGVRLTVAAVSKTANPTGGWYAYWWDEDTLMGKLGHDYPTFGVSEKLMVARMHSHFLVARADKLAEGTTSGGVLTDVPNASEAFPALQYGAAPSDVHFAPGIFTNKEKSIVLGVWAIDPNNLARVYWAEVPIKASSYQGLADQKGHPDVPSPPPITASMGRRVMKSVYRDGKLYAVWLNAREWGGTEGLLSAIHLGRLDVSHFPQFIPSGPDSGTIDRVFGRANVLDPPGELFDYYWPSLDVNQDGTIGVSYCRSGKTAFVESRFSYYREADADIQPSQLLHKGEYPLTVADNDGEFGVLDYTDLAVDPTDGRSFWVLQPYAEKTGTKTGNYRLIVSKVLVPTKVLVPAKECKEHFHTGVSKDVLAGLTQDEARAAARKKWQAEVAGHDGSAWSNWSLATDTTAPCAQKGFTPSPPPDSQPTKYWDCSAKARPCSQ
jgi:hypothetical protein